MIQVIVIVDFNIWICIQETVNNLNLHIKANALELKDTSAGKIIKIVFMESRLFIGFFIVFFVCISFEE